MSRYNDLQTKGRKKQSKYEDEPSTFIKVLNIMGAFIIAVMIVFISILLLRDTSKVDVQAQKTTSKIDVQTQFDTTKRKWKHNQIKNLLVVEEAANYVKHPNPKRMGAHLLSESGATTVLDGDKMNGFSKKSYGIMQVKLGTVYYVKNKRPDLIKLYAPEVNSLPKEDILDKLRKDAFFNAKIAALTHIVLIDVCGDQNRATVAYNRGVCTPDELGTVYLNKILKHETEI